MNILMRINLNTIIILKYILCVSDALRVHKKLKKN